MVENRSQESQKEKEWTMTDGYIDSEKNNCQHKALRSCQEVELRLRAGEFALVNGKASSSQDVKKGSEKLLDKSCTEKKIRGVRPARLNFCKVGHVSAESKGDQAR